MEKLRDLGIAENTLVVAMADNGPMAHNPPPGGGFAETIFRGGKGDFLEGGVRVPAFAWWPGVIKPGKWSATSFTRPISSPPSPAWPVPWSTYLPIASLTASTRRRCCSTATPTAVGTMFSSTPAPDWVPPSRGTTNVTGSHRTRLAKPAESRRRSISCRSDPREKSPMLANLIHLKSPFNRMLLRHQLWKKKYPDSKEVHGIPWTGIANAIPGD